MIKSNASIISIASTRLIYHDVLGNGYQYTLNINIPSATVYRVARSCLVRRRRPRAVIGVDVLQYLLPPPSCHTLLYLERRMCFQGRWLQSLQPSLPAPSILAPSLLIEPHTPSHLPVPAPAAIPRTAAPRSADDPCWLPSVSSEGLPPPSLPAGT